jgi:MFS family permease
LFAFVNDPVLLVVVQLLDGITASVLAVMVPLVVADLTRNTGHFNLGQGIVGTATGIGASLSATFAGFTSDRFGSGSAFSGLALIALVGLTVLWFAMPETRPEAEVA